ncbi:FxLD family lanthipeptide [Nocardioides speluncae]|nr:FxLD family lanthipeptide [Nocardioides speluncae]
MTATIEPDFDLDIQVVTDAELEMAGRCGTNDGCAATCPSSCVSRV